MLARVRKKNFRGGETSRRNVREDGVGRTGPGAHQSDGTVAAAQARG